MTYEKAIKILLNDYSECPRSCEGDCNVCVNGAMEMAIEALEKQIPKKRHVKEFDDDVPKNSSMSWLFDVCGVCGGVIAVRYYKYCPNCGQTIDWETT